MLLRRVELEAIAAGDVSVVFRRWRRPTVKTGGSLKTAVGVVAIDRITKIEPSEISADDIRKAGFDSHEQLRAVLDVRKEGSIYRIELHHVGADPRVALREDADLDDEDFAAVRSRLDRLDAASEQGAWTCKLLRAIEKHPHLAAVELAARTGFEKDWLKRSVRKLTNLGLTISHHPGYELSLRGRAVLERLGGRE